MRTGKTVNETHTDAASASLDEEMRNMENSRVTLNSVREHMGPYSRLLILPTQCPHQSPREDWQDTTNVVQGTVCERAERMITDPALIYKMAFGFAQVLARNN